MNAKRIVLCALVLVLLLFLFGYLLWKDRVNVGVVLSPDMDSAYRSLCLSGVDAMKDKAGLSEKRLTVVEISAAENCYNECAALAEAGCNLILGFGDGIEDGLVQAATEYAEVSFCMAYGEQETNAMANYHCFSPTDFQSRYIAGVAAGMKLNDRIENGELTEEEALLGYAAAFKDPENISAFTAFYLGARSVCKTAELYVEYSYTQEDTEAETRAVMALIANGCEIIAQQTESLAAAQVCRENDVYYVGYLAAEAEPSDYYIASANVDMGDCLLALLDLVRDKEEIPNHLSVPPDCAEDFLSGLNRAAFAGQTGYDKAVQAVNEAGTKLLEGSVNVFALNTWTVDGERVETTAADELSEIYHGREYIDPVGYFMENELSARPKFAFIIDGVTELNYTDDQYTEEIGGQEK